MKKVWQAETDRQTDRQTDRHRQKDTERQTVIFLKENPFENVICEMLAIFFRPKYRLIRCVFFIKVCHQPKLKREIEHISKFQNKILYQSKKKITWYEVGEVFPWGGISVIFSVCVSISSVCDPLHEIDLWLDFRHNNQLYGAWISPKLQTMVM